MKKTSTLLPGLCAALLLLTISVSAQENATSVEWNGSVYTFGGATDILGLSVPSDDMRVFDPGSEKPDVLKSFPPWPEARSGHSASVKGDKMYIFGGKNANGMLLNDMWEFDMKNRRWKKLEPTNPPMPRSETVQCVVGDIAYVCGGTFLEMGSQAYVHALNLTTPTAWIPKAPMQEPLESAGSFVNGGQINIFGGKLDDYNTELPGKQPSYSANTWQYTPTSNQWQGRTTTGTVPELADFGICQDEDQNAWVSGGVSYDYAALFTYYQSYLAYMNVATGEWTYPVATDDLFETSGHTLVYVPDGGLKSTGKGKLYHIGGRQANGRITERIVEYDIATKIVREVYHPSGIGQPAATGFSLSLFPNPAEKEVTLSFTLSKPLELSIPIFDLAGRRVLEGPPAKEYEPGTHTLVLDISSLPAGIYAVRISSSTGTEVRKLVKR